MDRRSLLQAAAFGGAALAAAPAAAAQLDHRWAAPAATARAPRTGGDFRVATDDGAVLHLRDWGAGRPVLFLAGWGLTGEVWGSLTVRLCGRGLRCLSYDRRGHGRSGDGGGGHGYDRLADDLAAVIADRDLRDLTIVAHSMSGGEAVRYVTRHGPDRIARVLLLAPTTPFLLRRPDNPDGIDPALFARVREQLLADFPKWLADNEGPFFLPETSPQMVEWTKRCMLQTSMPALLGCHRAQTDTDFRDELRRFPRPVLVVQGDADASAPLPLTGARTAELVPGARLTVYSGAPHGLYHTHAGRLEREILDFVGS